jgi:hypothetical protein
MLTEGGGEGWCTQRALRSQLQFSRWNPPTLHPLSPHKATSLHNACTRSMSATSRHTHIVGFEQTNARALEQA